jgi:hypothetical protein
MSRLKGMAMIAMRLPSKIFWLRDQKWFYTTSADFVMLQQLQFRKICEKEEEIKADGKGDKT